MTKGEVKPPSASPEEDAQVDERPSSTPLDANIAMRCVLNGKLQRFIQCFEDEEDPFKETVNDMLNERDDDGKTPMDMAAVLGRVEMMKELINRGAEVNNPTSSGSYDHDQQVNHAFASQKPSQLHYSHLIVIGYAPRLANITGTSEYLSQLVSYLYVCPVWRFLQNPNVCIYIYIYTFSITSKTYVTHLNSSLIALVTSYS